MAIDTEFVRGADKLKRRISTIRTTLALPALTESIGQLLLRRTLDRFDREVSPNNEAWAPLKEETERRKKRDGFSRGKLKRTLALRNSIKLIRGGAGTFYTNTGAGVRIGVEDPEIAEYGGVQNRGSKTIPARQFLGIGRLDIKAVDSLLRRKAAQLEAL